MTVRDKFCEDYGITSTQFMELRKRLDWAASAQTQEHSCPEASPARTEQYIKMADEYAASLGIVLRWHDGLYPSCIKGELDRLLPE